MLGKRTYSFCSRIINSHIVVVISNLLSSCRIFTGQTASTYKAARRRKVRNCGDISFVLCSVFRSLNFPQPRTSERFIKDVQAFSFLGASVLQWRRRDIDRREWALKDAQILVWHRIPAGVNKFTKLVPVGGPRTYLARRIVYIQGFPEQFVTQAARLTLRDAPLATSLDGFMLGRNGKTTCKLACAQNLDSAEFLFETTLREH